MYTQWVQLGLTKEKKQIMYTYIIHFAFIKYYGHMWHTFVFDKLQF